MVSTPPLLTLSSQPTHRTIFSALTDGSACFQFEFLRLMGVNRKVPCLMRIVRKI